MSLDARLEHVRLAAGWTGREFARRAGLRQESHYGVLLARLRAGGVCSSETLQMLIQAGVSAGFRAEWILSGEGPERAKPPKARSHTPAPGSVRRTTAVYDLPSLPNRERAAQLLSARGVDREHVDEALALIAHDVGLTTDDRPVAWWLDAYRLHETSREK